MIIAIILLGLAIGSFLNVCIDRLPAGQSLFRPGSHCPHCEKSLAARDLVPVASYLFLRGKCRYCAAHIPVRIPIVEAVTGLLFLLLWWRQGLTAGSVLVAALICVLIVIAVIDWENRSRRHKEVCNDIRRHG